MSKMNLQELKKDDLPEIYCQIMNEIGLDNTIKIAKLFGGQYVYFHKAESVERPLRDRKIREEFNGYNYDELAKKYNLTGIMIRYICDDIIDNRRNRPMDGQATLFSKD